MKLYDCIIIGGGAAGLTAAIQLGRQKCSVLLIEQCKELGKKLYATGNGRCNFSNSYYDDQTYRGDSTFANAVYQQFTYGNTLLFMHSIGVLQQERGGCFYPYTNQAKTVVEAMIASLPMDYVELCLDRIVQKVERTSDRIYHVSTSYGEFDGKCILLACGGKASVAFRREPYNGYALAEQLGHSTTAVYPALCALVAEDSKDFFWKGIRANAALRLYGEEACQEPVSPFTKGEIQFTDYGISGIPVFQISRYAALELGAKNRVYAQLDFLPEYSYRDLILLLNQAQFDSNTTLLRYLCGYVQEPLAKAILTRCQLDAHMPIMSCSRKLWEKLMGTAKQFVIPITGTADWEHAQVTAGGVETRLIEENTMESKISLGCFFAGEMLNVDGTCGGYNLQFAFSSAMVAVKGIIKRLEKMV